jgi:hypothetical protein
MLNKAPNYELALGNGGITAKTSALDGGERLCLHLHRFIPDMVSHISISVWTRGGVPAVVKEDIFVSRNRTPAAVFRSTATRLRHYTIGKDGYSDTDLPSFLPSFLCRFDYYQTL